MNTVLSIFAVDKAGNALSGVQIRVSSDGDEIGSGTTRGPNKPFSVQIPPTYDSLTVDASYQGLTESANIPAKTTSYEIKFDVDPPPPNPPGPTQTIPKWFPIAGFVSAAFVVLFFMA